MTTVVGMGAQGVPLEQWQYVSPNTGAKVTLANAKALIYHYCAKLPSDKCASAPLGYQQQRVYILPAAAALQLLPGRGCYPSIQWRQSQSEYRPGFP